MTYEESKIQSRLFVSGMVLACCTSARFFDHC